MTKKSRDWLKSLVLGIGVNDADYVVNDPESGRQIVCPYYRKWHAMLRRCNDGKNPAYDECYVCDEWTRFMSFRQWMEQQDWHDKEIDKDLLVPGNKVYSPETCIFVSRAVNIFLVDHQSRRGIYPVGVYLEKGMRKFKAQIAIGGGKRKHLGRFDTVEEAANAYSDYKRKLAFELAERENDPRVSAALISRYCAAT